MCKSTLIPHEAYTVIVCKHKHAWWLYKLYNSSEQGMHWMDLNFQQNFKTLNRCMIMRETYMTESRWPNEYYQNLWTWPKNSQRQTLTWWTWPKNICSNVDVHWCKNFWASIIWIIINQELNLEEVKLWRKLYLKLIESPVKPATYLGASSRKVTSCMSIKHYIPSTIVLISIEVLPLRPPGC